MSVHDIAFLSGKGYSTIQYWMRKLGIARREREESVREAVRRYPVRSFVGDLEEKAYLFGLSFGDLHVSRVHKSIAVYTSTSVHPMVDLLVDTFVKYSRPSIRPTAYQMRDKMIGGWRFRTYLDLSFAFLLEKYSTELPRWILSSYSVFLHFLAGLFDAEGHSGIYDSAGHNGGATSELTFVNTDIRLIRFLRLELRKLGFHPRIIPQLRNGHQWYKLSLGRRKEINRLLRSMPFRHPKKKGVARFLLRIPTRMSRDSSWTTVNEFKQLKSAMKEDDRREGEASLA